MYKKPGFCTWNPFIFQWLGSQITNVTGGGGGDFLRKSTNSGHLGSNYQIMLETTTQLSNFF